jgi:hypothetical protein
MSVVLAFAGEALFVLVSLSTAKTETIQPWTQASRRVPKISLFVTLEKLKFMEQQGCREVAEKQTSYDAP